MREGGYDGGKDLLMHPYGHHMGREGGYDGGKDLLMHSYGHHVGREGGNDGGKNLNSFEKTWIKWNKWAG